MTPLSRKFFAAFSLVALATASALAQDIPPDIQDADRDVWVRLDDLSTLPPVTVPAQASHFTATPEGGDLADPMANVDVYMDPACGGCGGCDDYWGWTILPTGLIYRSYLAGVKESRLGLNIVHVSDNVTDPGYMFDGTLGGRVGLFRYGNRDPFFPQGFQVDVEAAAQVRLSFEEEMDVQATDYRVGVPLTYGWGNQQIKFGYYHLSSHLGDEFLIKNPTFLLTRFNYAKDNLVLGYSNYVTPELRLYGEVAWAFWSDVAEPWECQFGFDYAPACPTGIHGAPFAAANVYLRQEIDWSGSFCFQTGWAWRSDTNAALLRMGLMYYTGNSPQFSFYNQYERQIGVGIWYDF